jgi:type IV secretory pathway TrbL component
MPQTCDPSASAFLVLGLQVFLAKITLSKRSKKGINLVVMKACNVLVLFIFGRGLYCGLISGPHVCKGQALFNI